MIQGFREAGVKYHLPYRCSVAGPLDLRKPAIDSWRHGALADSGLREEGEIVGIYGN